MTKGENFVMLRIISLLMSVICLYHYKFCQDRLTTPPPRCVPSPLWVGRRELSQVSLSLVNIETRFWNIYLLLPYLFAYHGRGPICSRPDDNCYNIRQFLDSSSRTGPAGPTKFAPIAFPEESLSYRPGPVRTADPSLKAFSELGYCLEDFEDDRLSRKFRMKKKWNQRETPSHQTSLRSWWPYLGGGWGLRTH